MNYNNNKIGKGLDEELKKMQNSLKFDMSEIIRILKEENSTDIEKILILKNKSAIIKLYLYIINKLIGKTGTQEVKTGGGRKPNNKYKRRDKTIKKRRPNRQRTYKK